MTEDEESAWAAVMAADQVPPSRDDCVSGGEQGRVSKMEVRVGLRGGVGAQRQ